MRTKHHSSQKPFTAEQFTATQWDTAADKAKFANHLVRFLATGSRETLFYDWFYKRLSNTFGHIAHYNRQGFYAHFFTTVEGRERFQKSLALGGGYGDPAYTYSDVEKAVKAYYGMQGDGLIHLGW